MLLSAALKEKRKAVLDKIAALLKAVNESEVMEFTEAQAKEFDDLEAEVKRLDEQVDRAERAEKSNAAASSVPATDPVGDQRRNEARPKEPMKVDKKTALVMAASLQSKLIGLHPLKILDDNGYGQFVMELAERNGVEKSVNTLTPAAGGILMPEPARGELLDLLYPATTFLQGNPQRVPLVGGQYEQPYGVTGATAAYVGEGGKKPVSDLTFGKWSMKAKKLAGIVLITKEARKWLLPNIVSYVERNLRIVLPQQMDTAAFLGTGVGDSPQGILNKAGIGVLTATGRFANPKAPTLAELDAVTTVMTLYMTTRDIGQSDSWAWWMNPRTLEWLKNIRVGNGGDGVFAFPELQGTAPRWKGTRVLSTNKCPANLGATTDESLLALVNWDDVMFGEEETLEISSSTEATIDVSGTLVHLFQQNMFAMLAEMEHDFGVQRLDSVVRLNGIRWGAP